MISPRVLRRRIRSVQSTAKITKSMEMIATAKMRRTQESALAGRPYAEKIIQLIADLAAQPPSDQGVSPLLEQRHEIKKIGIILITSDRGLCGGLNTNINRLTAGLILEQSGALALITVGRKGRDFMRSHQCDVRAEFTDIGDRPSLLDIIPIARVVIDDYSTGYVDQVYLAYTRFVSTMLQRPVLEQLLPVKPAAIPSVQNVEYIYEPAPTFVLNELLPRFVEMEVYHAILEAIASEQSARMVAMRNATDNANELIESLTLALNKARQEMITTELLDITGGAAAVS